MSVRALLEEKGAFVSVVSPEASVQDVVDRLESDDTAAVVVSRDGRMIEGIVSTRSIVRGLGQYGRHVVDRSVRDVMTSEVITCDLDQPVTTIYRLMDAHQIRHIPITDDGRLCGIVNTLDVIRYRLRKVNAEAEALKDYVSGRT